jgi:transposase-like protein
MEKDVKRNHYNDEFKREAVKVLLKSNKPVIEMALILGVEQSVLHRWKKKYAHEFVQKLDALEDGFIKLSEYQLLRQEIASIKETIEVLRNVIKKSVQHNLDME